MTDKEGVKRKWAEALSAFLPGFMEEHPVLSGFRRCASVLLHGSLTLGFDDEFADIDMWLLVGETDLSRLDEASETRFFEMELDGKPGHLNADSVEEFSARVRECHMDSIYQLRRAVVLMDHTGAARELKGLATRSMRPEVAEALFFYHYVEMRGEHRACDNPMERADAAAVLLSLPKVIAHALRAAMVLDREPYPWDKWLYYAARETATGRSLAGSVEKILDLVGAGNLRFGGPEAENPISQELRTIRRILVETARAKGMDAPWLDKWWLHMDQARAAMKNARW